MPDLNGPPVDVLIADDDASYRECVRLLLESAGYRCAEAGDGLEAVELARRLLPRCVLLDLAMPRLDGYTAARALRSDPYTSSLRIHCLTGITGPEAQQMAQEAGCERFLAKPVRPDALLRAVGATAPPREVAVVVPTLAQAEALLDWLENLGCTASVVAFDGQGVTLCVTCPEGLELVQDAGGEVRAFRR
jgi:CheY-like chemotaxis protein